LISVLNYQMPEYGWFSVAQNKRAATIGLLKASFFPISVDRKFHLSDNGRVAFLWCQTNVVYVYRDEPHGLIGTMYFTKTNDIEQRPHREPWPGSRRVDAGVGPRPAADCCITNTPPALNKRFRAQNPRGSF
jgi:hypothetical protein